MTVKELIARSKAAQEAFAFATQEQADAAEKAKQAEQAAQEGEGEGAE